MPFDSSAAFLERSHVLELQSQMDEEERRFKKASDEAVDINLLLKILEWEDQIVPFYILAIEEEFLERSHVLELQSQMDEEERRLKKASDEAVDINLLLKILEWEDQIVPFYILAIEEEAHMHCKMLAREEAADMQVNQERMQEAFAMGTRTGLGDEDA